MSGSYCSIRVLRGVLKDTALLFAKIGVSLALLAYLLRTTDLEALLARVRSGDPLLLVLAVVLYCVMTALSMWRWKVLISAQGYEAPIRQLSASYLVAGFFNNFLPSNIGGDVIRVRDSSKLTGSKTASLVIIAADRILGFAALYLLAALAFILGGPAVRHLAGARVALLGLGVLFTILTYIYFREGTARAFITRSGLGKLAWIRDRFEVVQGAVHVYRQNLGAILSAFGASVALQALFVYYYYSIAGCLRIPLPLSACFLMVPLCTLVQTVPISFNGWGVRESVFILYFAQVNLPRDNAMAFSLVGAGLIVLLSLSGAVVWTARGRFDAQPT